MDSVVSVATRLSETGHYGAERITSVSSRLQEDWKGLTTVLEDRSSTLSFSTGFHHGAEQVCVCLSVCVCVCVQESMRVCMCV